MADNQDEKNEQEVEKRYQALLAQFLEIAAHMAEVDRKERAGEKEQRSLRRKLDNFAEQLDLLRADQASREQVPSLSLADLIAGYEAATRRHTNVAKTPYPSLNAALGGGLEAGTMIALLGAPGAGKTAMANHIAEHVANQGRPVVYVTSENSPHVLFSNTIARLYGINCTVVRKGHPDYMERITDGLQEYSLRQSVQWMRYIDATVSPYTWAGIEEEAQRHFETGEHGTGLLVVDYLQKLGRAYFPGEKDFRLAVSRFTSVLRTVASRLNCCVLILGSQGRVSIKNKTADYDNVLTSGKESGDIEYDVDALAAILKPEQDSDPLASMVGEQRILVVAKNRLGGLAQIPLVWTGAYQKFAQLDITVGEE